MAFRGRYQHNLDSKDRLTVPARFRAPLADGVVLCAGLDPCLAVYPTEGFESFSRTFLGSLSPLSAQARTLRRYFEGSAFEDTLDAAGRIRVPRALIDGAGLSGGCVVVGMGDHFEVWNAERWAEQEAEMQRSVLEAAEAMAQPPGRD